MILEVNEPSDLLQYILKLGGGFDEKEFLNLPESLGKGYLRFINPFEGISLLVQQFELNEELFIKRLENKEEDHVLIFSFRNILIENLTPSSKEKKITKLMLLPSVQVSTSDMALDIKVQANTLICNIIIGIEIDYLKKMLPQNNSNKLIEQLLDRRQAYLYEEIISPSIQLVANDIFKFESTNDLAHFFYKLKAEELIYLFLSELSKREQQTFYSINQHDLNQVYNVRDFVLSDLEKQPELSYLAQSAGMSVSKLSRVFKQIFGDSIYNYYQKMRMQKAVFLLKEDKLSVSEVGYQLGFSNLSHFSRLFEKHIGLTPKKFSKS